MNEITIFLDAIVYQATELIVAIGYTGILIAGYIESVIPLLPSELVLPLAGFRAAQGDFNLFLIPLFGSIGSTLGALTLYFIGARLHTPTIQDLLVKYGTHLSVDKRKIEKARSIFRKHGVVAILIFRLIPLGRSYISLPAGYSKVNVYGFTFFTLLGTYIWSFILTYAGFVLGESWQEVSRIYARNQFMVAIVILAPAFLFILYKYGVLEKFRFFKKTKSMYKDVQRFPKNNL